MKRRQLFGFAATQVLKAATIMTHSFYLRSSAFICGHSFFGWTGSHRPGQGNKEMGTHMNKLNGKVAVVTGASKGIGAAIAKALDSEGIIDAAIKNYGRLDVLVNNSGVYEFAPIESITEEQFHKLFNINVLGAILTTQAAVKHLGEGASIINIGSGVSRITPPNSAVYTGTKAAIDGITGVLARELGPKRIRVNSINPGMVETEG